MSKSTSLIAPPLGGKFEYPSSVLARDLSAALAEMSAQRDEAESREIALWRLAVAVISQALGGEVHVDAALLGDKLPHIRTEHDRRTGLTRVWIAAEPADSGDD